MQVEVEPISAEEILLKVDVEPARVERHLEAAYRKLVRRYRIPGFRPGRAPRAIFERFVGRGVLMEEALDKLVPEAYREALAEAGVTPYEEGRFEDVKETEGGGIRFQVKVYRQPKVVLPPHQDLDLTVPVEEVTPAMIDDAIEELRRGRATLVPVEEAPADGVVVVSGVVRDERGEEPFEHVELRLADAFPEIREGLTGVRVGDTRTVTYQDGERTRTAEFRVEAVQRAELPAVDEDFARALGHETLEELRAELSKYIAESLAKKARDAKVQKALDELVAKAEVEVPAFLVEREVEHLRTHHPGEAPEDPKALEEEARERVRRMLVVDRLIEQEGIRVSEEELLHAAAAFLPRLERKSVSEADLARLHRALLNEKLTAFLARLGEGVDEDRTKAAQAE